MWSDLLASCDRLSELQKPWMLRDESSTNLVGSGWEAGHLASANEVTACAASIALDRPICILSDAAISLFSPCVINPESVKRAMCFVLHDGHYQYATECLPEEIVQLLQFPHYWCRFSLGWWATLSFMEYWKPYQPLCSDGKNCSALEVGGQHAFKRRAPQRAIRCLWKVSFRRCVSRLFGGSRRALDGTESPGSGPWWVVFLELRLLLLKN